MHFDLPGKSVIITGASSGIGKSIALRFARQGARLTLVARHRDALDEVARSARALSADAAIEAIDVTDATAVRTMVERTRQRTGAIDVVVAAAGQYVRAHG